MTRGACLCGTVRFETTGPATYVAHCHCSMCRKHHGALYATLAAVPLSSFRWLSGESALSAYPSSAKGNRSFCSICGSVAPVLLPRVGAALVPLGSLQGALDMRPQAHVFVGSKAPWHTITDSLPQFERFPPGFDSVEVERPRVEAKEGVVQGSCLCSDVAYEMEGPPVTMRHCHCTRCRRARSAAHATNALYRVDGFRWTRGEELVVEYRLPEAKYFGTAFCRRCGGSVPRISRERNIVIVPAGPLDTDPGIRPESHIFVNDKANWYDITDETPQYAEAQPL